MGFMHGATDSSKYQEIKQLYILDADKGRVANWDKIGYFVRI